MTIRQFITFAVLTLTGLTVEPTALYAQTSTIDSLEADGVWCPMAHCNRNDNSYQDLPPILSLGSSQKILDPTVSPGASRVLGCVSGESMAVCAYDMPNYPALAAFDYQSGGVIWKSPPEDLPGTTHRVPAGLLLAKMGINGDPVRHWVFAANPAEFVAYVANGVRVWKRPTTQITTAAPNGVGMPISLSFDDAKEIVTVTNTGWIIKLNPVNGSVIDAYQMSTNVVVNGALYHGIMITNNSPAILGNVLYLVTTFQADASNPLDPKQSPVHVVRIELTQPDVPGMETKIKAIITPLSPSDPTPDRAMIGINAPAASPVAWVQPDGKPLIFTDADAFLNGKLWPAIAAVVDDHGTLSRQWRSVINFVVGDDIHAAPGFDSKSRTLLVGTTFGIYVFRDVDTLSGDVPPPLPLSNSDLIRCGMNNGAATARVGSPFAIAYDQGTNEIVAATNFQITQSDSQTYGYLGAFALPAKGPVIARPVWCFPLALNGTGSPAPGNGTAGQPAQFRYAAGGNEVTGLIVNTLSTGTYIIRSAVSAVFDPSTLLSRVSNTQATASLIRAGYALQAAKMIWPVSCPPADPGCIRYVNNPITRYGEAYMPTGTPTPTSFPLDGDDAFVVYGTTPPPITYYSFTINQYSQYNPVTGQYFNTASSIGLSLNQENLNSLGGPNNTFFALIVAADFKAAYAVHQALLEAGVPEGTISHLLFPARFANRSLPFPDQLGFVLRLTQRTPGELQMIKDYIAQSPSNMQILFFDGPGQSGDVMDKDLPNWKDTLRTDASEADAGAGSGLATLVDQIISKYQAEGYTLAAVGEENLQHVDPQAQCRDVYQPCNFDAPDALYARFYCPDSNGGTSTCLTRLPDNQGFLIVAGVNHHAFSDDTLNTYFSYAVTRYTDLAGVVTFIDLDTAGSSVSYLGDTGVDPSTVFAMKISRSCGTEPYCLEVPWGTNGVSQYNPFMITERIYLDKVTASAPNPASFTGSKLLWFVK